VKSLTKWVAGTKGLSLVRGHARFVEPHVLDVDGRRLQAPRIFLNTGARVVEPDWPGLAGSGWLSNRTLLDLDVLPEHLLIVGGSYIGLEFAQVFRRFGSRVTVVEHGPRIVGREDEDVSTAMRKMLEAEGIRFVLDARGFAVERLPQGIALAVDGERIEASHLLVAVGRRPNTDDLGAEAAGLALDKHGYVEVDDQLRTKVEGIWALGDMNGRGAFTHTSYNDFEIVAANLLDGDPRRVSDRIPVYALFTDPPLARIGQNEAQVRETGRPALIATMPMTRVGRARERSETTGFMKVLVDAESSRILGASLFGIEADEAIHALLDVMAADAPYTVVSRTMNIHPTVGELLPTLLQSLRPL
jgi:pyruvate/2-oxoglutarate dehydrogenase complex dihydrolipoamide dehydrogenase (E3) component